MGCRPTAVLALIVGLTAPGCASHPPSSSPEAAELDRTIAAHTLASGGRAVIEQVRSVEIELSITEPAYTVEGIYRATRDRRMRIDVFAGGRRVYSEAFDGTQAWDQGADDPHGLAKKSQATAALLHGIDGPGNLLGLHEATRHGIKLALLAPETLEGVPYDVIAATYPDGFATYYYLNRATHRLERQRDQRALHPDADPGEAWIERRFSDFRAVDGRLFPFREEQVNLRTGAVLQTSALRAVRLNVPFDQALFRAP